MRPDRYLEISKCLLNRPLQLDQTGSSDQRPQNPLRAKLYRCLDIVGQTGQAQDKGNIMPSRTRRSEKLDLRLTRHAKRALQAAAAVAHRSVSEFVLESALARAAEALADRRSFGLNATQWKAFLTALDAPSRPLPRMERLLKESVFFDGGPRR
jgi:uncharacterized protein (DUF1778 family)